MSRFVLDASRTLAWCFEDEATEMADKILESFKEQSEAVVPSIWPLEVANALLVAERRGRLRKARVIQVISILSTLPVEVVVSPAQRVFSVISELARAEQLSVYDAAYLDCAIQEDIPVATLDGRLSQAASSSIGVDLFIV